ncbi:MAG: TraR/DksA C4-type zinc finger protein [Firmicutes bacterium]|nr:TraR/DksA C4-type zinc finger protein [Bacillota bacterium]
MTLKDIEDRLLRMERLIEDRLAVNEQDSLQSLSAYDNHPADLGSETSARELDVGLSVGLARHLDRVRRALEKLEEGTYGRCDRCGAAIGAARLAAMPDAIYCMHCQQHLPPERYAPPPSEETVWPAMREAPESGEPDADDFWQSVARWGNSNTPQDTPPAVDYHQTYPGFEQDEEGVEAVEELVDADHEVLWEALRARPRRHAESTSAESDEDPLER